MVEIVNIAKPSVGLDSSSEPAARVAIWAAVAWFRPTLKLYHALYLDMNRILEPSSG